MKEKKDIQQTIEKALTRAKEKGEVTYADEGILIVDDIRNLPREETMQNRDMTIFVLCKEGHMQVNINGKTYDTTPRHLLVCSRLHVLTEAMISTVSVVPSLPSPMTACKTSSVNQAKPSAIGYSSPTIHSSPYQKTIGFCWKAIGRSLRND